METLVEEMKVPNSSYTLRAEQHDPTLICLSAVKNLKKHLSSLEERACVLYHFLYFELYELKSTFQVSHFTTSAD
jgi:hypothetical protein